METVALLYEDYQKELAEDFKNTFLKRASDTDSSRSNDTVIDEVTDMLSTNIAVYTEKLLQRWGFSSGGEGGGGGDVTVTLDDLLKKYLSDNYVTIKGDQEVFGEKDFRKGIRIAGRRLYWDEGNDALVIEGAAYTTRWLSAKGVSKGSGGTGGASTLYQLVDVLANDTEDGVEGAAAGKALVFDGTHWRAGDAGLNESQLYSYLTANKYLTQSAADSRYVTSSRKVIAGTGLSGGGALTSDVTLSLGTSGVVAGTYTKVMVDAYGRVTSGTNLSATDIPNLDWSKITTGKPTTLAGYGITDAVTLTTAQTISGRKTFSQNIVFNNNGGITYTDSNVVLRNSDGHTILASFGNGEINLRPNGHNNTEGAVWINKKGNVQAPSVSTNTIMIGDAQLVYDSKNKALRVKHRTDGNTVGFYSDGWITALGVQTGGAGGGSGVIKTVYSFANLTDGTTFSDSDLNNTFNAYTVKEIWKMAKEGGGIKNIAQSGSGNAITDMTLSSDGKTITAVFGETFARQQDLGTLNNTVTQLSNKLNNFLEGLTGNDTLTELLALKADKTITISAGTGLTGGGNLSANRTLSLATTGVKAGTYTKVTVDTYGRVTVGDNPTTLAGYGITDAYTKTEADGKYVTIATAQTVSGAKTFSATMKTSSVLPSTDANSALGGTANRWSNVYSVNGVFSQNVTAKLLSASESLQIGDAYLKWDAANNAVYVIKKDGTTPVGFYSTDWLSAKGLSMSGAQTGTLDSLNDVEITDPVNGQALKYDAASKKWVNGTIDSFNVNQMWAELKKADSSKIIDASHIPTSVLDGRWVKKAGDTMTGTLTSASSSGSIVFKGVENCDITNIYKDNGVIRNDDGGLTSIRNGLRFNWYDTYWYIGNLRGSSTDSAGFGVVDHNNKLVLRVTPNDVRAPRFMSTVATGLSPLIVSSNTLVNNLNSNYLEGYNKFGFIHSNYSASTNGAAYVSGDTHIMLIAEIGINTTYSTYVILLSNEFWGHQHYSALQLHIACTNNDNNGNKTPRCSVNVMSMVGSHARSVYYKVENNKAYIFIKVGGGNQYGRWASTILQNYDSITTNNANTTGNITLRFAFNQANSGLSDASYVNYISSTGLATSRTLWGQSFDGTANVSGNMTGVGSITMSGNLEIGNGTSPNAILFYGTTGDSPGGYNHTFIAERLWGGTESSELVLFKGNDLGNDNEAVNVSNSGPDRIRHIAAAHLFQTYTSPLAGSVEDVCTSSALKSLFDIAANRVTSYVPFMSTVASGTAPFIVVSNTVVGNLNADLLDGVHLAGLSGREGVMRSWLRGRYTTVNQYFGNGNVVTIDPKPTDDATLSANTTVLSLGDVPTRNTQLAFHYDTNTIKYRRHDDSKWNDWVVLIHSGNYASYSDGRYVKKAGDTMTGDLAMDTNKGFYIPHGTRVVKTSGNWIHGGGDTASSTDANLRFASWNGIGWYPTIDSTSGVRQGNNAMWLNVRTGVLDVHSNITSHNGYLAANWDSARRLVLGCGSSYAYIDSRDSSNNILCNIVLHDNKVYIGNYAESNRFVSTVGTGTQPYQCNSTTLNTNLNADMLDNWHLNFLPRNYNIGRCYAVRFALGGEDNGWKKIFACSESGATPYRSVTVWGRIWYAYGNHAQSEVWNYHFCAIFYMRSGPSSSDSSVGNVENSARLYLPTFAKGMDNIRLVRVGTNNFELQVRQIGSYHNANIEYQYWSYGCNVSAWERLQSTSNTSVAVSAGGASTLADSRASSADVWTTARTFYIQDYHSANTGAGVSVNGGSNCYLKLPSTTRFSRIDFSTPNANIRHSGNDNGNEVGSSTLSNLVIDSWYGVSFTTTCSSTYQNKIAMSVNCRTGRVTANNFHAATNITANGAITAKASSSDIRLKTDIQGYDAMGIIRKFRSVKYHWNAIAKENSEVFNHDNWNYGLIAQDLLSGGYSQWVKDAFNDYYTIDYERLIPVVWKGLQEVDDEVTKLKREVARLNKRVKELEKSLCA